MPAADVVLTWFSSSPELDAVKALFQRPTRFVEMPAGFVSGPDIDPKTRKPKQHARDYAAEWKAAGGLSGFLHTRAPDVTPLRVALIGFSQGCQGPRAVLRTSDAGKIDAAIATDGIHTEYGNPAHTTISVPQLAPWGAFARAARSGGPLLVVTTSAIVPGGNIVSTTETANWVWRDATGQDQDIQDAPLPPGFWMHEENPPVRIKYQCVRPIDYHWAITVRYRRSGNLVIVNYGNLDPTGCADHIYQSRHVQPLTVASFLADRWNRMPPGAGVQALGTAGLGMPAYPDIENV
jgi:hypothetical protein